MMPILGILVLCSATGVALSASLMKNCAVDEDCGSDMFCFKDTKICTKCLSCKTYMRHNPEDMCVKEPKDCGNCLDGYNEEKLTTGKFRDLCTLSQIHPPLANTTAPQENIAWLAYVGLPVIVAIVVFTICFLVRKPTIKARAEFRSESVDCSSDHNFAPSAPPSYETVATQQRSFSAVYEFKERQNLLQATPFNSPQWVSNSPNDNEQASAETVDSADAVDGPQPMEYDNNGPNSVNPDLAEDETVMSTWSPPQGYGNQDDSDQPSGLITSFEGLFPSTSLTSSPSQASSSSSGEGSTNHTAGSSQEEEPIQNSNHPRSHIILNVNVINGGNGIAGIFNNFGSS